ncbi:hypothetical protein DH2020_028680 [Rehmannia glutinosa]|uniref:Peptidase A1 domain-containing protein n=1 Tax=Rehmannia glutinosa TaxID=99300 RepID=A0ABR0VTQ0_REHGL
MASPVFILLLISSLISLQPSLSNSALLLPLSHSFSTTLFNTTTHHHHHSSNPPPPAPPPVSAATAAKSPSLSPRRRLHTHLLLGSQTISLYIDTGSDVVWLPCYPFECILCEGEYSPSSISHPGPLNLTSAAATACRSAACSAVHSSLPLSDLCAIAKCPLESIETGDCKSFACPPFYYAYGDGSFVAKLYEDTLTIPMSSPPLKLPKFTFGCANSALAEPIGVAGFGRGALSLPAQLATTSPEIVAVTVGKIKIPAPESLRRVDRRGNGGMVVDSGTTFTMLPKKFYQSVVGSLAAASERFTGGRGRWRKGRVSARVIMGNILGMFRNWCCILEEIRLW